MQCVCDRFWKVSIWKEQSRLMFRKKPYNSAVHWRTLQAQSTLRSSTDESVSQTPDDVMKEFWRFIWFIRKFENWFFLVKFCFVNPWSQMNYEHPWATRTCAKVFSCLFTLFIIANIIDSFYFLEYAKRGSKTRRFRKIHTLVWIVQICTWGLGIVREALPCVVLRRAA